MWMPMLTLAVALIWWIGQRAAKEGQPWSSAGR